MSAENEKNHKRAYYGRLAGWVGIVCNMLLSAGKFIAGTFSGSVSITADALNNFSDASSSLISLIGFQLSELRAEIERFMSQKRADIRCVITVDRSFAAIPPDELPRED